MKPHQAGYTVHGHPIPNRVQDHDNRPPVARCGGIGVCFNCTREAGANTSAPSTVVLGLRPEVESYVLEKFADQLQVIVDLGPQNTGLRTVEHVIEYARGRAAWIAKGANQ